MREQAARELGESDADRHPAYGVITVGRASGSTYLFGSEAHHQHFIHLEISTAYQTRQLADDHTYTDKRLIDLAMSESQWAHFVSSMNMGGGTPVTIRYLQGQGHIPELPQPETKVDKFKADMRGMVKDYEEKLDEIAGRVTAMQEAGSPKKSDLNWVSRELQILRTRFRNSAGFVASQFNENMERTMSVARQEIEAYFNNRVQQIGLSAVEATQPVSLPDPTSRAHQFEDDSQ